MKTITEHVSMGDSLGSDDPFLLEAYRQHVQALLPADFLFEAILCHPADPKLGTGCDDLDAHGVDAEARQVCWERALADTP